MKTPHENLRKKLSPRTKWFVLLFHLYGYLLNFIFRGSCHHGCWRNLPSLVLFNKISAFVRGRFFKGKTSSLFAPMQWVNMLFVTIGCILTFGCTRRMSLRPNVELFMRATKVTEWSSWKVRRLAQLSSTEWVWIVQHVLSVPFCFRRTERLKIVYARKVNLHRRRTKLTT